MLFEFTSCRPLTPAPPQERPCGINIPISELHPFVRECFDFRSRPQENESRMMKSLSILGSRCFSQFRLNDLGRINLLVGTNNSGKTSILEALHLPRQKGTFDNT